MISQVVAGLAAGSLFLRSAAAQSCASPLTPVAEPVMADGYEARLIMNGLRYPRHLVVDAAGNLLVAEQRSAGIRRVVLNEAEDGGGCVESSSQLIPDPSLNHGIALTPDGSTLFVSKLSSVDAYPYDASAGTVGEKKTVISGMENGGHPTRTLTIPVTAPDVLLVSRGSDGNIDNATIETSTARSIIKSFNVTELLAATGPVDYATGGEILGWGLRNSVGVAEDPSTGGIWSVENSADNVRRGSVDIHNENPAEELNYHGVAGDASNDLKGANYGYPVCFAAWDIGIIPENDAITMGSQFGGVDGTPFQEVSSASVLTEVDEFCRSERQGPRLAFPSHTAPLDIRFREDGNAAYVAFHGSWNRSPPDGYRLGMIEFSNGQPVADVSDRNAVTYIMQNRNDSQCPRNCFRPTGLAFDSKGRLFMTSDATGELFVITGA
ncbi:hypothetical protein DL764_005383 [Monosporascus ibericus]|uniref:Pyrroloquinoline quinone-dependent pyranose dehydrogenase beta-propeller domain-containing protein n=1 Tax=Monosporascus ibericus TaxID=155417 RepID=A0A4Q4TCD7_9PEZI|nr:hypothetical protein DL764_005383 [Monosporascus ibericus]